ncbi:MAG TPA: arylamine N-acetyltransferase [Terriglobales bacterium]|jgi:N-hydroxyarylamine O-acetyltransferase|nr:arylamine N-acetyltransferase [Terriglobales bacterium]
MNDVRPYLARIAYTGPTVPNAETLRALHRAHMMTVPFENLDIARGREIVCDEDRILKKIVGRKRGGFCYEMNGAFAALLRGLGFKVTLLSARVPREDGSDGPEFDHLTLRVDLNGPWLADVGFGDSFLDPLRLELGSEQPQDGRSFRIVEERGSLHVERLEPGKPWKREYSFGLAERRLEDFSAMCHYHQTSPESPFTRKSVCTRATVDGRITLAGKKLIVTRAGQRSETVLTDEERVRVLREEFGVVL